MSPTLPDPSSMEVALLKPTKEARWRHLHHPQQLLWRKTSEVSLQHSSRGAIDYSDWPDLELV